jgi:Putative transposase
VLAYLARYTHWVAISNSRLVAADSTGVTFRYKDYRIDGPGRYKTMTLKPRVPPPVSDPRLAERLHRIRHYGLLASGSRTETMARVRELIAAATPVQTAQKAAGC